VGRPIDTLHGVLLVLDFSGFDIGCKASHVGPERINISLNNIGLTH
jgi:hypothetical protein